MNTCLLMTDSPCDLPADFLKESGVEVVHFSYTEANPLAGRNPLSGIDDMFSSLDAHSFYEAMRKGAAPMTSQPSQLELEETFERLLQQGIPVVYLCFSSGISGCYDGALLARDRVIEKTKTQTPLYVVDLRLGSTPQSLLVQEAIRQRDRGLSAEELAAWAQQACFYIHTIFMVDDLSALKRGGRIPASVALAGSMLGVKPLLTIDLDGKLKMIGVARGRKKAIKKMACYYMDNHSSDAYSEQVAIGVADCPKDRSKLEELISKEDDSVVFLETQIGPTIGCHVGPGMMACSFWGVDRRQHLSVSDKIAQDVSKG